MLDRDAALHSVRLAQVWYHDRLDPTWRRKTGEEVRALFDELGVTGPFWALA